MDIKRAREYIEDAWEGSILGVLHEYIKIPNQSPDFDPEWKANGHMDRAADLLEGWAKEHAVEGMTLERFAIDDRTPLIFMEIPGDTDDTVLLYGHFDKQPPMEGWEPELGPWKPVIRDGKLYGRGGADDGYAIFASLTAIRALKAQGIPHARCVVIIEGCEESGSPDLPFYIDHLEDRIGDVSLVVCLDSGCANYEQMWVTTSLRGMVSGTLTVSGLTEGVHSGEASGVVASTFRVLRQLLTRIEDEDTGEVLLKSLHAEIPEQRKQQADATVAVLGDAIWDHYPFVEGAQPVSKDSAELLLNRTWRPTLSVTGVKGLPAVENAGNVLRPSTALKLSFRMAPTANCVEAVAEVKQRLEADPPFGYTVTFDADIPADGWNAPPLAQWLEDAAAKASSSFFGKQACFMGEGGSIPFMGMLGAKFPKAQFLITGVLGPKSNAHGPNEFLEISCGKNLTGCVASVLADHKTREG